MSLRILSFSSTWRYLKTSVPYVSWKEIFSPEMKFTITDNSSIWNNCINKVHITTAVNVPCRLALSLLQLTFCQWQRTLLLVHIPWTAAVFDQQLWTAETLLRWVEVMFIPCDSRTAIKTHTHRALLSVAEFYLEGNYNFCIYMAQIIYSTLSMIRIMMLFTERYQILDK